MFSPTTCHCGRLLICVGAAFVAVLCAVIFLFRLGGWVLQTKCKSKRTLLRTRVCLKGDRHGSKRLSGEYSLLRSILLNRPQGRGALQEHEDDWSGIIGFLHPFCNAGGGGERVLWSAIHAIQYRWPNAICAIYSGDMDVDKSTVLNNVMNRFNIKIHAASIHFIYVSSRKYVSPDRYRYLTLCGQTLGSLLLALDGFRKLVPDILIDTTGYAFALAFCHLLFPGVATCAYVHYPTITTDMLQTLKSVARTNASSSAASTLKVALKRRYWLIFAVFYSWAGRQIDVVSCNSSWTSNHLEELWSPYRKHKPYSEPSVLFPPVAVTSLIKSVDISAHSEAFIREPLVLYIAQFRPEKNHALILKAFHRFLEQYATSDSRGHMQEQPKLVMIGTVRDNLSDADHISYLRRLARELGLEHSAAFVYNAEWNEILRYLRRASIGVNGMWNEHFGMSVVEYQAAGLISVVHNSGGPRKDIVIDLSDGATGYHATTIEEFAAAFAAAFRLSQEDRLAMRLRARRSSTRFTEEVFEQLWVLEMQKLM